MTGLEPATSDFQTAVIPDICILQDTKVFADLISARHGQFEEKEKTPTTEINIFLSKKFYRQRRLLWPKDP